MALTANALVTVEELKDYLSPGTGGVSHDDRVGLVIGRACALIEQEVGRDLVSRGSITEYHTVWALDSEIRLSQWPTISVTTVHEDPDRTYGADTLLVVNTDYIISKPLGKLIRISEAGGCPIEWDASWRAVKVVHAGGYATTTGTPTGALEVPPDLKEVALKVCAKLWSEAMRQQWGISGASDAAGNWTRFESGAISKDIREQLSPYRRWGHGETWERDA